MFRPLWQSTDQNNDYGHNTIKALSTTPGASAEGCFPPGPEWLIRKNETIPRGLVVEPQGPVTELS